MHNNPAEHRNGVIAVTVAAILWSTGGLFIKLLPFDAFTILCYRSACAAIVFGFLARKRLFQFTKASIIVSLSYTALLVCFVTSTKLTTAANAIFLQYTAPIYILLLEPVLFKLKIERINIIAIVACLVGMSFFMFGDLEVGNMTGNILALGTGVFLAVVMLGQRFNKPELNETAIFWGNILVILVGLPSYLDSPTPTFVQWGMLLFLGFIQIGLGYALFTYGLKRTLAIESALIAFLEPILNPVWVFLGYGERPSTMALIGGLIIIGSLVLRTVIRNLVGDKVTATERLRG
ncbi:MAG: EamA family transporter [Saprospiraceae bacterium]|nr:EamA family transporter [Saprospiraceae bacterium]